MALLLAFASNKNNRLGNEKRRTSQRRFLETFIVCKKEHFPLPSAHYNGLREVIVMALKLKDNEALALKSLKGALL